MGLPSSYRKAQERRTGVDPQAPGAAAVTRSLQAAARAKGVILGLMAGAREVRWAGKPPSVLLDAAAWNRLVAAVQEL